MTFVERRASPRGRLNHPVSLRSDASSAPGTLKTLSRMGALVVAPATRPIGESVRFHLEVGPLGDPLDLLGQVIRVEPAAGSFEIVLLFAPLPPQTLSRIDAFLAAQPSAEAPAP